MEKKEKIIQFTKAGNGSITPRISLPASWVEKLGVTQENKNILTFQFENGDILISKTFKREGIMEEKLKEEAFNFGVKAKKILIEQNKNKKLNYYITNILKELKTEKLGVMYYILNLCLDSKIDSENFFMNIINGDKNLVTFILMGLMN